MEYQTSDLSKAAVLTTFNMMFSTLVISPDNFRPGQYKGVFCWDDVDKDFITKIVCGEIQVEPITYARNIQKLKRRIFEEIEKTKDKEIENAKKTN
jgi:hypothetical protein